MNMKKLFQIFFNRRKYFFYVFNGFPGLLGLDSLAALA